jgi:hypothetical protein
VWVFEDEREGLAGADAEHTAAGVAVAQLGRECEHVAGARGPKGVAGRDGAAVGVQALVGDLEAIELVGQLAQHPERLRGVGLMNLPHLDIRRGQARAGERLGDRERRRDPNTAPEPDGLRDQPLSAGEWIEFGSGSFAILPYGTVRTARDPRRGLLAFCQSAYEAGARLAGWDTASFESAWCPSPTQLQQLHANAAATFGRTKEKDGRLEY